MILDVECSIQHMLMNISDAIRQVRLEIGEELRPLTKGIVLTVPGKGLPDDSATSATAVAAVAAEADVAASLNLSLRVSKA